MTASSLVNSSPTILVLWERENVLAVTTQQTHIRVVEWMINDNEVNGEKGLHARIVKAFPEHFRGMTSATIMKSSRWWEKCATILQIHDDRDNMVSATLRSRGKPKRCSQKLPLVEDQSGLHGSTGCILSLSTNLTTIAKWA